MWLVWQSSYSGKAGQFRRNRPSLYTCAIMSQTNPGQRCDMQDDILEKVVEIIKTEPHSGLSLSLYALVSTLKMENSGYMYMLRKLRDLSAEHRALAYGLMELMARNGNQGKAWETAVQTIDRAIREG
jgi:hypothetical protein